MGSIEPPVRVYCQEDNLDYEELHSRAEIHGRQFKRFGKLEDVEKAIEYGRCALDLTPRGHPEEPSRLTSLGIYLQDRFQRLGDLEDMNQSMVYLVRAVELTPENNTSLPFRLGKLGRSYIDRFRRLGTIEDLKKSIECGSRALELTPSSHPDLTSRHAELGLSYIHRYRRLGAIDDLEKSIRCFSRALDLTPDGHPDLPSRHTDLGATYSDRYRRLGVIDDLEKSMECFSCALELTPDSHPELPSRHANIGLTRALELTPDGHPGLPSHHANLGLSYSDRYGRLGAIGDLEKSIECFSCALGLTPSGHPDLPSHHASLGVSYNDRYRRLGAIDDLEKAIQCLTCVFNLTPDDHPDLPSHHASLGVSYSDRYQRLGAFDDLEKAIQCRTRALELTPDGHPDLPFRHASLGVSSSRRYRRLGVIDDLEKSIECFSRALELTPDGHPDLPSRHANLGLSYSDRHRRLGVMKDLEKSIKCKTRALNLTPEAHPALSLQYSNLAMSYHDQYKRTADPSHLKSSLDPFRKSSQLLNGAPRDAFTYALKWTKFASQYTYLNPVEAFRATIELLPHFIWLGATTSQRYQDLALADNVALRAASAAIQSSNYNLALEWLEHARCVVWNQTLMLRSPVEKLMLSYPDLASRIQSVSQRLHRASSGSLAPTSVTDSPEYRHRLAPEYEKLLAEVRLVPEFEDFICPNKFHGLKRAARNGLIVVINCYKAQCDALLVLPSHDHIAHLALLGFTERKARHTRSEIEKLLQKKGLRERGFKIKGNCQREPDPDIGLVLADIWNNVVKPVLNYLGYINNEPTDDLPHITWCPTGALNFLPLHAAGDYEQPGCRVFNHVISSYTPTLSALLASNPTELSAIPRVLVISQAATSGYSRLPGTARELEHIRTHTQDRAEYTQLIDRGATPAIVLDAMEQHDWVHLACHAQQNIRDPTKSGFFLHGGTLGLAAITQRSFRNKGLAFLSACQTATGDEKLPDEAIHLASGMLMAGYPSVIASMWSVMDADAPFVADRVYAQLMKVGKIGNGEAGKALHYAVAGLREKVGEKEYGRWVTKGRLV
ncbi:hypothetical protein BN14_09876 [Rhizoctonia solani AG-1 IB]|uniref:CHAT domain-containing protein n=1 Tax=Thanatephorus cucumeris (strain AG1-IB / isolate 7/3/14) TaxID=1108050 RepID=M5C8H5_THACB|nr:hypothetical protein BN14_09876 [Rhizoctonia solani AG-1 IB]